MCFQVLRSSCHQKNLFSTSMMRSYLST
uniref:Uncharacterized protein n=1 Tax=Anguilla anguilla TaxID=7936 RepID=A0A0E9XM57_ANGAN